MKALIWILTFILGSILNILIGKITGIQAGAVLLYLIEYYIAKKLCQNWDERNKLKTAQADSTYQAAQSAHPVPDITNQHKEASIVAAAQEIRNTSSDAVFCRHCGKKLLPDSAFCSYCGTEVVHEKNVCRVCGNELTDDSVFCNHCGSKVNGNVEAAEVPVKAVETAPQKVETPAVKSEVTPPKTEETYIYDVAASGRMVRIPASQHALWREMQDKIKNGTLSEQEKLALQNRQAALSKALSKSNSAPTPVRLDPCTTILPDGTVQRINLVTDPAAYRPMEEIARGGIFEQSSFSKERAYNEKKANNAMKLYFAFVAIAIILVTVVALNGQSATSAPAAPNTESSSSAVETTAAAKPALVQQAYPENGYIFVGKNKQRESQFTINASSSDAFYIKLKDANNDNCFAFFVCPRSTVTVDVPEGKYNVVVASGRIWYGLDALFGPDTLYAKESQLLDFSKNTYECTISPPANSDISRMSLLFSSTAR